MREHLEDVSEVGLLEVGEILDGSVRVLDVLLGVLGLESVSLLVFEDVDESKEQEKAERDTVEDGNHLLSSLVVRSLPAKQAEVFFCQWLRTDEAMRA